MLAGSASGSTSEPFLNPYLIESVSAACRRKADTVTRELQRGLTSLANISATASLLGLLGTVWGIMNSFHSVTGSKSSGLSDIAESLSDSLLTTTFGLFVAVFALCAYRHLSGSVAKLRREMDNESIDLVNKLILHVRRSGNTRPLYFGDKSKKHLCAARSLSTFAESTSDAPRFRFDRIYPHGLPELLWPRLQSNLDAEAALHRGMWIAFIAAAFNALLYFYRPVTAGTVAAFLIFAGLGVRRGSFFMTAGLSALLLIFAACKSISQLDFTASSFLWATTAFCLAGTLRTAWAVSHGKFSPHVNELVHSGTYWSNALFVFLAAAFFVALFPSPLFERNVLGTDPWWMESSSHAQDEVVSTKGNWFGGPYRGTVVAFSHPSGRVDMARVVGIPGDQVQLRSGTLIRNGKVIDEPYCHIPRSKKIDDFPPRGPASPQDFSRELQRESFGDTLIEGKPFTVPAGTYFVLNDDRSAIFDSRIIGPIKKEMILGRAMLAYDGDDRWRFPKFVH